MLTAEQLAIKLHTVKYYAGEDVSVPLAQHIEQLHEENVRLRAAKDADDSCMTSMLEQCKKLHAEKAELMAENLQLREALQDISDLPWRFKNYEDVTGQDCKTVAREALAKNGGQ